MYAEAIAVEDRLRTALSSHKLNADQAARAEALLSRIVSPVRVAVLGRRGSGKSSIVNLLAGGLVLPSSVALPTTQVSWGDTNETTCTYADQSRRTFVKPSMAELTEGKPIFLSLERTLPALRQIALLEVVMDGTPAAQARALSWAASRCDLAVWCSRDFDAVEQALWAAMPDALKKHAFLALTHVDTLRGAQARSALVARAQAEGQGSFQQVVQVNPKAAIAEWKRGETPTPELLEETGARALTEAIFGKVTAGYTRVREAAETLLDDAVLSVARALRPDGAAPAAPIAPIPGPQAVAAPPVADTPAPPDGLERRDVTERAASSLGYAPPAHTLPTPQEAPRTTIHSPASSAPRHPLQQHLVVGAEENAAPGAPADQKPAASAGAEASLARDLPSAQLAEAAPPTMAAPAIERPPETEAALDTVAEPDPAHEPQRLTAEGRTTVVEAISYLAKRGETWRKVARHNPDAASRQIMEEVLGDAEWLASYLDDPFEDDEALLAPCRNMAMDIVDLVQLMEIERTETATVDAVCLLLQARRRLQALAVAA
ncbi:MAG: hypothetical protein AAGB05_08390 [Pseudomonadota bacterium]